jgi:UDP-N-acetylmuramoyl-L-alanyl-D-glutamate--2,6-diaminopimelate ligase
MGEAAARLADRVFLTSDNPRSEVPGAIMEEIKAGIDRVPGAPEKTTAAVDREEAIEAALQEARPGDLILIAGKGHERTQTIGHEVIPFDDREVARRILRQMGYNQ